MTKLPTCKLSFLFTCLALALTPAAHAQSINPGLDDAFQLRLGPFFANVDTKFTVADQEFTQEDAFSDNETTLGIYALWRITPKLHLSFGYSEISRDSDVTTQVSEAIGGIDAPPGTQLIQSYKTASLPIALEYAFVKNPKTEFGLTAGVTLTTIQNDLTITVPGAPPIQAIDDDVSEPLPAIGLFWNQALSPQFMFKLSGRYMGLQVGDIDADIYEANAAVEWRPAKNFGVGASYLYNKADGVLESAGTSQAFSYEYAGPFVYLMLGFGKKI